MRIAELERLVNFKVESIDRAQMKCRLIHAGNDRSKDLIVTAVIDDESKTVEWDVQSSNGEPK